jgi:hypothetical protein
VSGENGDARGCGKHDASNEKETPITEDLDEETEDEGDLTNVECLGYDHGGAQWCVVERRRRPIESPQFFVNGSLIHCFRAVQFISI